MKFHHRLGSPVTAGYWKSVVVVAWLYGSVWCVLGTSSGQEPAGHQDNCLQLFDTYDQGVYVCHEHPDLMVALEIAERTACEECQRTFRGERWNCSGFSILKAPNVTSIATKEAAYVHSLSLAAIAHSVAKVCAMESAVSCLCDTDPLDLSPDNSDREYAMGCSDNVGFAINFATQFLRKRHQGASEGSADVEGQIENEAVTEIFLHNLRTAAEVVRSKISVNKTLCKCVGVSGTCTLFSCPVKDIADFSKLAREILNIYQSHSCHYRITTGVDADSSREGENDTIITSDDRGTPLPEVFVIASPHRSCRSASLGERYFLFLEDSPNYCLRDLTVGSLGTVGRECNPHSTGHDSCEHLCTQCGRGLGTVTQQREETCYCSFTYCCVVQCHKCLRTKQINVCV